LIALCFIALLAFAPFVEASETPDEPSEAAMTFAGGFSGDQLAGMLSRIGARQPPLMALGQMDGSTLAAVFDAEIARAVEKHGAAWQRNMAIAWMPLMSDEELSSLTVMGGESPHVDKYLSLREQAGARMQVLSSELFQTILEEVIGNTLRTLTATGSEQGSEKDPAEAPAVQ
jgi:hypothetical protein